MKYFFGAAALFAATVSADLCAEGSVDDGGNWYCQAVKAITYTGVGAAGSYDKITNMDANSGTCSSQKHSYSGTMSPLDEEVSLHFRGPLSLKQFAVYTPASSKSRRDESHERRHAHGHAHQHLHHAREAVPEANPEVEERAVGDNVIATINGKIVSWVNEYTGQSTSAPAAAAAAPTTAAAPAAGSSNSGASSSSQKASSGSSSSSSSSSGGSTTGSWGRQAYYNSKDGTSQGLVFLNHEGGTAGSGTFDYKFGNSLSYAASDGSAGAATPQTLHDTTLKSTDEIVIYSDQVCKDDCDYSRPGTVAHHGFDGPSKAFFFEFGMPSDGQTGNTQFKAINMPAIWMLNAQIPRTLQYGVPECSCWKSGCGEFDIFEVLAAGDKRCKSTLHGNVAGGNSDYFDRPLTGTVKAALLLYNDNIHIKVLDDNTDFGSSMDSSILNNIADSTMTQGPGISLFKLAGALAG